MITPREVSLTFDREVFDHDALPVIRGRHAYPLTIKSKLAAAGVAITTWKDDLTVIRCELKKASNPQSAALAEVAISGASIAAQPADGPVFAFTAAQLSAVLDTRPQDRFWLVVTAEGTGGAVVDFGEAFLFLHETNASVPVVTPPAIPDIYATQSYVQALLANYDANSLYLILPDGKRIALLPP